MSGRRGVVRYEAADGTRRRRYDHHVPDSIALAGATEAETRHNVSVAAIVSTLHRLGAAGVNIDVDRAGAAYTWTFACRMRDGTVHTGQHVDTPGPDDEIGIAVMHAGAACIRSILDGKAA